jgi:uncharacterized protein (DUF1015 family)
MLYRDARGDLDGALETAQALTEFTTSDGVRHSLAKVRSPEVIRAIVAGVARSTLLIADGHHRYETAVRYSQEVGDVAALEAAGHAVDRGEHRYFMSFLANGDDPDLVVFPTHRLVHSLASFSLDDVLRRAAATFDVTELPQGGTAEAMLDRLRAAAGTGRRPSVVVAVPDGRAAVLALKASANLDAHPTLGPKPPVLRRTDVTVLHAGIFEAFLGITPEAQVAKTNLWYVQDAAETLAEMRAGVRGQALFLMNPTPVAAVRDVAEAGEVMPQKSTFFYPKVATGLAIHTLDPLRPVAHV